MTSNNTVSNFVPVTIIASKNATNSTLDDINGALNAANTTLNTGSESNENLNNTGNEDSRNDTNETNSNTANEDSRNDSITNTSTTDAIGDTSMTTANTTKSSESNDMSDTNTTDNGSENNHETNSTGGDLNATTDTANEPKPLFSDATINSIPCCKNSDGNGSDDSDNSSTSVCFVVDGSLTVYWDENVTQSIYDEVAARVYHMLKRSMDNGQFLATHDGIVRVEMYNNSIELKNDTRGTFVPGDADDTSKTTFAHIFALLEDNPTARYSLIFAPFVILIVCMCCCCFFGKRNTNYSSKKNGSAAGSSIYRQRGDGATATRDLESGPMSEYSFDDASSFGDNSDNDDDDDDEDELDDSSSDDDDGGDFSEEE